MGPVPLILSLPWELLGSGGGVGAGGAGKTAISLTSADDR